MSKSNRELEEELIHPKDLRALAQKACATMADDMPRVKVWEAGFKEGVRRTCSKNAEPLTRPENMLKKGENVNAFPSEEEIKAWVDEHHETWGYYPKYTTTIAWLKARMNGGRG